MADYSGLKRRAVEDDNEDDITEPNTDEESVTPNSDTASDEGIPDCENADVSTAQKTAFISAGTRR